MEYDDATLLVIDGIALLTFGETQLLQPANNMLLTGDLPFLLHLVSNDCGNASAFFVRRREINEVTPSFNA